jgi:hypothetical protein
MKKGDKNYGTLDSALDYRDRQIVDLFDMLKRWRGSIYTRHIDIGLLERVIHERNNLERNLIIANNTIHALTERKKNLEIFAANYDPERYAEFVQSHIQSEGRQQNKKV